LIYTLLRLVTIRGTEAQCARAIAMVDQVAPGREFEENSPTLTFNYRIPPISLPPIFVKNGGNVKNA
jgi:hypothetical protein